jgi:hypothetical protein
MKRFSSESRGLLCARFLKRWSNLITEITGGGGIAGMVPARARLDGYSIEIKLLIVRGLAEPTKSRVAVSRRVV